MAKSGTRHHRLSPGFESMSPQVFPENLAGAQNDLDNNSQRIWGDRAKNLELAITVYENVQVYTR